jgi:hypothetical protein
MSEAAGPIARVLVQIVDIGVNTDVRDFAVVHSLDIAAPSAPGCAAGPEVANLPSGTMKNLTLAPGCAPKQLSTALFALVWCDCRTCVVRREPRHG